jgi:hypothetical protein
VAGFCECGDEPSGSITTELVSQFTDIQNPKDCTWFLNVQGFLLFCFLKSAIINIGDA